MLLCMIGNGAEDPASGCLPSHGQHSPPGVGPGPSTPSARSPFALLTQDPKPIHIVTLLPWHAPVPGHSERTQSLFTPLRCLNLKPTHFSTSSPGMCPGPSPTGCPCTIPPLAFAQCTEQTISPPIFFFFCPCTLQRSSGDQPAPRHAGAATASWFILWTSFLTTWAGNRRRCTRDSAMSGGAWHGARHVQPPSPLLPPSPPPLHSALPPAPPLSSSEKARQYSIRLKPHEF